MNFNLEITGSNLGRYTDPPDEGVPPFFLSHQANAEKTLKRKLISFPSTH
jgi:hypothetical protein